MKKSFLFFIMFCFALEAQATIKLAVLGDSFATGIWTEPGVSLDPEDVSNILDAEDRSNSQLQLSLPDSVEFTSPPYWVLKNAFAAFTQVFFDRPDNSWVLPYSKQLGIKPADVKIMARDGASISDALLQVKSLLKETNGQAPQRTILFFSLMDVCAPNVNMFTSVEIYERHWFDAISYYLRHAKFDANATIEIWAPLNITQVIGNDNVMNRPTSYGPQTKTCREIANLSYENMPSGSPKSALYMMYPSFYCSALMVSAGKNESTVNQLNLTSIANRLQAYRQKLAELVKELSKSQKSVVLILRDDVTEFQLTPERIGPDCLHLNAQGHSDLAEAMSAD